MRRDFQRRGNVQTFSRARVQAIGDGVQLVLRVPRQVRALGQVLAQQAIGIPLIEHSAGVSGSIREKCGLSACVMQVVESPS